MGVQAKLPEQCVIVYVQHRNAEKVFLDLCVELSFNFIY